MVKSWQQTLRNKCDAAMKGSKGKTGNDSTPRQNDVQSETSFDRYARVVGDLPKARDCLTLNPTLGDKASNDEEPERVNNTLCDDLGDLLGDSNPKYSDVRLWCRGKQFHAHKVLLAARSRVFDRLFAKAAMTFQGRQCNSVDVKEVEPAVFEVLLRYIYTDRCSAEDIEKFGLKLLDAAKKYEVVGLQKLCEDQWIGRVSVNNVGSLLIMSKDSGGGRFQDKLVDFVARKGNMSALLACKEWDELLKCPDLLKKILAATEEKRCQTCNVLIQSFLCQDCYNYREKQDSKDSIKWPPHAVQWDAGQCPMFRFSEDTSDFMSKPPTAPCK